MRKAKYTLDESFSVAGQWWLPDKSDEKVYGTFRFNEGSATLEIVGAFETVTFDEIAKVGDKFNRHACIHGLGSGGEKLALYHAHVINHSRGPVASAYTYSIRSLVVGAHAGDADAIRIKKVWLQCEHFDEFIGPQIFAVDADDDETKFKGLTVRYLQPDAVAFRIEAIATNLSVGVEFTLKPSRMKQVLHAQSYAAFEPDEPQNIDWCIKTCWRFCYLLTILTNEKVSPLSVRILIAGEDHPVWLLYRTARQIPGDDERVSPILLFYLCDVFDQFSPILDKWFSVEKMLLDGIHLFMDAQRNRHPSVEARFLLLAQATEVVSRSTTDSEYMTKVDFKPIADALAAAIPDSVGSDHKRSLTARLQFLNEFSLKKRITTLLASMSDDAQRTICNNPKEFAQGVADTRNYLTHYTDDLRQVALQGAEMHWLSEKLSLLLRIALLKYLSVDESLIVKRLKEHPHLIQTIVLAREHREFVRAPKRA